jgi:hypothetical protein
MRFVSLASVTLVVACGRSPNDDIASPVQQCELDDVVDVCTAPAQSITASADEASAPAVVAGTTYAIAGPGAGHKGYVVFTPAESGTHTLYFGDAEPLRVCDEEALCASAVTSCGDLHRAAQYALMEGEPYVIELKPSATNHPFRLHVVGPEVAPPPARPKLGPKAFYQTGRFAEAVNAGDIDGDGAPEILVSNPADYEQFFNILRNNNDGTFSIAAVIQTSHPRETVISDFDSDGDMDIVGVAADGHGAGSNFFLHNDGDFMFTKTSWFPPDQQYWGPLSGGDFDEDGVLDLVALLYPDGQPLHSGFVIHEMPSLEVVQEQTDFGEDARDAITGDFNGDGHQDVLVGAWNSTALHLWIGDGSGMVTFDRDIELPITSGVERIVAVDLDGNAYTDFVAVADDIAGGASVTLNSASGFSTQLLEGASGGATAGDFNHDGRVDLITGVARNAIAQDLRFYRGTSSGFVLDGVVAGGRSTCCMVSADLDNDGYVDLVTSGTGGNNVGGADVFLGVP